MLKNPKQCSRGEPTTMGANMWDAVGQPSWNRSVKKYQRRYTIQGTHFTILPFCSSSPCSFLLLFLFLLLLLLPLRLSWLLLLLFLFVLVSLQIRFLGRAFHGSPVSRFAFPMHLPVPMFCNVGYMHEYTWILFDAASSLWLVLYRFCMLLTYKYWSMSLHKFDKRW